MSFQPHQSHLSPSCSFLFPPPPPPQAWWLSALTALCHAGTLTCAACFFPESPTLLSPLTFCCLRVSLSAQLSCSFSPGIALSWGALCVSPSPSISPYSSPVYFWTLLSQMTPLALLANVPREEGRWLCTGLRSHPGVARGSGGHFLSCFSLKLRFPPLFPALHPYQAHISGQFPLEAES